MKKLEITKGEWGVLEYPKDLEVGNLQGDLVCSFPIINKDFQANAILIADAGTTYNKLPILPSQLANDRERLIEFVKNVAHNDLDSDDKISQAQELLNSLNQ